MINTYIEIKVFVMKLGHMLFKTALFMKYNVIFSCFIIVEITRGFILKVVHIFLRVPYLFQMF